MPSFTDSTGREWQVAFSVGTAKACRELLDVDLCDLPCDFELLQRLRNDDYLLANVLYVCCRDQCERDGISDEAFGRLLADGVIEQAEDSLWKSITAFFRGGRRQQIEKALAMQQRMEAAAIAKITDERTDILVDRVGNATDKLIEEMLAQATPINGA